ncbi:MAG: FtsQ-type POTRA domain-containing protein [Bacillota bacterium]|nr:FtsQ-type POTRA domain-containing protein [Bacillota bacterium]
MVQKSDHLKLVGKKEKRPGWKKALRFLSRLALVLLLFILLRYGESFFRIKEVSVNGAKDLTNSEIINAAGIETGDSIFLLSSEKISGRIKAACPQIDDVEFERILPDKVEITVAERTPVAFVMTADGYWEMDRNAVCFSCRAEPEEGYPLIVGIDGELVVPGIPLLCQERREALINFFSAWNGEEKITIEQIDIYDSYNMILQTGTDMEILLGNSKGMEEKLLLVRETIPYIETEAEPRLDVRTGSRLVVSSNALLMEEEEVDDP